MQIKAKPKGKPRGKPIQKGQVLNPKGRTKEALSYSAFVRGKLEEPDPVTGKTRQDELFEALYEAGKSGNVSAAEAINNRAHGKTPDTLQLDDIRQDKPQGYLALLQKYSVTGSHG